MSPANDQAPAPEEKETEDSRSVNKNFKLIILFVVVAVILVLAVFFKLKVPVETANLLTYSEAKQIVLDILRADDAQDSVVAYLYPAMLEPGDSVVGWDYDEREEGEEGEEEKQPKEIKEYTWLAWVDRDPGNVFFGHETEFVYINAVTGQYERVADDFWPSINGESFEGELTDMIATYELPTAVKNKKIAGFNFSVEDIKEVFAIEAKATSHQNKMRITTNEAHAPPGDYYALIVSGFGKNAWVFLEGAHLMYEALGPLGYDAAHIMFLAPYRASIDPSWSRFGINAPLVASDRVDSLTSPTNLTAALDSLRGQLDENDSLFVFMLTHGKERKFALGEPVSASERMGAHDLRNGSYAEYNSTRFAQKLLRNTKACEIMVLIDSCHAGTHEVNLRARHDPRKVKRLQVAHSTDATSVSYGADYRNPRSTSTPALFDLDYGAPRTSTTDPNPTDLGGEFSSGFIENMAAGIFSSAYQAGIAVDAARLNYLTKPYMWSLGESGPCTATTTPPVTVTPPVPQDQPQAPQDTPPEQPQDQPTEPEPEPEPEPAPRTMVTVVEINGKLVPHAQLRGYSAFGCDCCEGEEDHYHARNGASVTALDGTVIPDPLQNCGYGKVSDLPTRRVEAP